MISTNLLQAIAWNIFNVSLYKIILQIHFFFLWGILQPQLFGLVGTIFSAIYFIIAVTNFGFDYYIMSSYQSIKQQPASIKTFLYMYYIRFGTIIITASMIALLVAIGKNYQPILFFHTYIPSNLWPILLIIFITESIKKSLETLAQLSFLQKLITFLDISTLLLYVVLIWGTYIVTNNITLYTIFIGMAIISTIECALLILRLKKHMLTVSHYTHNANHQLIFKPIHPLLKEQLIHYFNQIIKAMYSPNFLIIILAYCIGLKQAGSIKLCTDTTIVLYMLLNKAIGLPSVAWLSNIPNPNNIHFQTIKDSFLQITNWYIQLLYVLACMVGSGLLTYMTFNHHHHANTGITILFFVFSGFLEYIIITYEKWYIIQKNTSLLALVNLISLPFMILIMMHVQQLHIAIILIPFIILRAITIVSIITIAYQKWDLRPNWIPYKTTLLLSLFILIIAFTIGFFINQHPHDNIDQIRKTTKNHL